MEKPRPVGVLALAVLHFGGGLLLVILQVIFASSPRAFSDDSVFPILIVLGFGSLGCLGVASGIGMWLGTRWGWWCGLFYYVYGVARNANAFALTTSLAEGLEEASRGPGYYYARYGGRVVVHLLIGLYFFKDNVRKYFNVEGVHAGKAVGLLAAITALIFAASTAVAWMAQ